MPNLLIILSITWSDLRNQEIIALSDYKFLFQIFSKVKLARYCCVIEILCFIVHTSHYKHLSEFSHRKIHAASLITAISLTQSERLIKSINTICPSLELAEVVFFMKIPINMELLTTTLDLLRLFWTHSGGQIKIAYLNILLKQKGIYKVFLLWS